MIPRPAFQERHFDYVLGPNQDTRLTSVAAGAEIQDLLLKLDTDAAFVMTSRAVRTPFTTSTFNQSTLVGLKSKWFDASKTCRFQDYVLESLQMVYYGQQGNPKPIVPAVLYPAGSVIRIDLRHTGANTISNLTFFFRGYKLFPWGSVIAHTYPTQVAPLTFAYPVFTSQLGVSETRQNQIFTVKTDADFVIRGGQSFPISSVASRTLAEVAIILKDPDKKPYSNDFVPLDILFGCGNQPAIIPVGPTPSYTVPFGTGPQSMGLFYPEIYVPKNHQLLYDIQRTDGASGSNQSEDFTFNLIGSKVFTK
jgi:hypothetical protein